ncbi:hypothetical protein [Streptomyces sp. NPDC058671]|uniref:hypothetical protein n=1 Tax=Streptomyces sp. NPDC058671 TaxID=3346590 RepID=UPI003664890B
MPMEPADLPTVDMDVPATWPHPLADLVGQLAADARHAERAPEHYQNLDLLSHEDTVLTHLEGHLVRARHHTRLLAPGTGNPGSNPGEGCIRTR